VLTLWDKGAWGDQQERIIVDAARGPVGGESIDALALVPQEMGLGKKAVCGLGDGNLRIVDLVRREVLIAANLRHDDAEGVVSLGFDCGNRLISAGGTTVKVWEELSGLQGDDEDEDEESDEDESDDDSYAGGNGGKRPAESDDDDDDDSEDGVEEMKRRAKRRKEAQQAKLGPMGAHGILGFEGMD
jgi:hypothetical protein